MRAVVIANACGWGNFGDDLLARAFVAPLMEDERVARVTVIGGHGRWLREQFEGCECISWSDRIGVTRSIANSRRLVLAGGGLLNDRIPHFYRPYTRAAALCSKLGGRVVVSGVGVLDAGRSSRFPGAVKRLSAAAAHFTVRDEESADAVEASGGLRPAVVPDLAYSLDRRPPISQTDSVISVCVRPWWHLEQVWGPTRNERLDAFLCELAGVVNSLFATKHTVTVRLIPFQVGTDDDDRPCLERLNDLLHVPTEVTKPETADEAVEAIVASRVVLGMRLHSLIIAANHNIPTVALSYDRKVASMMRTIGRQEYTCDVEDFDARSFRSKVERAFDANAPDAQRVGKLRELATDEIRAAVEAVLA